MSIIYHCASSLEKMHQVLLIQPPSLLRQSKVSAPLTSLFVTRLRSSVGDTTSDTLYFLQSYLQKKGLLS